MFPGPQVGVVSGCSTAPRQRGGPLCTPRGNHRAHLIPGIRGLRLRVNTNLQGWSSFGSPGLSVSLGCPKQSHNRTCISLHLPCTFSENRFQEIRMVNSTGIWANGPYNCQSCSAEGKVLCSFRTVHGCWGGLKHAWSVSDMHLPSGRAEHGHWIKPTVMAKTAAGGPCWLVHTEEGDTQPAPGDGCPLWTGWSHLARSQTTGGERKAEA